MGERSVLCTHQVHGTEMDQGHSHIHPNPCTLLGSTVGLQTPGSYPVMSASGNPANFVLHQIANHHGNSALYGDMHIHCHQQQLQPPASDYGPGSIGWFNFNSSYVVSSSSSGPLPSTVASGTDQLPSWNMMEANMHECGRNHPFMDDVRSCKGGNVGAVSAHCNFVNHIANFRSPPWDLSLNSGIQHWNEAFGPVKMMDATHFNTPEYRGLYLPLEEGSQRSLMSGPNVVCPLREPPVCHHHNHDCFFQGNFVSSAIQLPGSTRVIQFGNNIGSAVCLMSNCPTIPSFQGRSIGAGPFEIRSMCDHQESFSRNPVIHPPSLYHQLQHLPPVQTMQSHYYSHHLQALAHSYGSPVNTLSHHGIPNTSMEGVDSVPSVSRSVLFSACEESYGPQPSVRILSAQDNADFEYPGFHEVENFIDLHSDMRMDIDSMSYEELLALEEQIGDVKTGLTEEFIINNLKTRMYTASDSSCSLPSDVAPERGTCIICQLEYEENERIGTLDCGHEYHAGCIRHWLLVKNLCPVCKTSALARNETGQ